MRKIVFIAFTSILAFESCNSLFVPATPSLPVFEKGNSLMVGGSGGVKGWNANVDYSPLNHFYCGANYNGFFGNNFSYHNSIGGHLGYYLNTANGFSHFNFQAGYTLGNSEYADPFSGNESFLRSGHNSYQEIYAQTFYALKTSKGNNWSVGFRFDMYHAHYSGIWPNVYSNEVPIHTAFPMLFVAHQYYFKKAPNLSTDLFMGYTMSTIAPGHDVGYAFYTGFLFRIGLSYRFQFGKKGDAKENGK